MPIAQPARCPDPGLTFVCDTFDVLETSVSVGVGSRHLQIIPIDCFPLTRFADTSRFSTVEMGILNDRLDAANEIRVTIPEPTNPSSAWLQDLQRATPKPGWIWTDSAETVSQILCGYGLRDPTPDYPAVSDLGGVKQPADWPEPGLTMRVAKPVRVESSAADVWRLMTEAGNELIVSLIDCYCETGDYRAYTQAWTLLEQFGDSLALTLPAPASGLDWVGTLQPGTEHAGWLWLDETVTLNTLLVQIGKASLEDRS